MNFKECNWSNFSILYHEKRFREGLTIQLVYQYIRSTFPDKYILLLVDEVVKSGNPKGVARIVSPLLDQHENFNVLLTSLDPFPIQSETSESGRIIEWISIPLLSNKSALSLFSDKEKNVMKFTDNIITYCNGHPRSLQYLKEYLNDPSGDDMSNFLLCVNYIAKGLIFVGNNNYVSDDNLIVAALKGIPIQLDTVISKDLNFAKLIQGGFYINTPTGTQQEIPKLSPIYLLAYALNNNSSKFSSELKYLLQIDPTTYYLSGTLFEHFHAHWEVLWRQIVRIEGSSNSKWTPRYLQGLQFNQNYERRVATLLYQFNSSNTTGIVLEDFIPNADDLFSYVFICAKDNPGFDILIFERFNKTNYLLAIEARYSSDKSRSVMNDQEIMEKYTLTMNALKPFLKGKDLLDTFPYLTNP